GPVARRDAVARAERRRRGNRPGRGVVLGSPPRTAVGSPAARVAARRRRLPPRVRRDPGTRRRLHARAPERRSAPVLVLRPLVRRGRDGGDTGRLWRAAP